MRGAESAARECLRRRVAADLAAFGAQHFLSFFKTLIGKVVIVELKNDLALRGVLHSVDQFLNIKLTNMTVVDPKKYPHLVVVNSCFVRGSVVRYVHLPAKEVDTQLLQDASRRAARPNPENAEK
jgi:U6 snRNA-associated Sm-like protein LSm2